MLQGALQVPQTEVLEYRCSWEGCSGLDPGLSREGPSMPTSDLRDIGRPRHHLGPRASPRGGRGLRANKRPLFLIIFITLIQKSLLLWW